MNPTALSLTGLAVLAFLLYGIVSAMTDAARILGGAF